jgi:hypothetical protein
VRAALRCGCGCLGIARALPLALLLASFARFAKFLCPSSLVHNHHRAGWITITSAHQKKKYLHYGVYMTFIRIRVCIMYQATANHTTALASGSIEAGRTIEAAIETGNKTLQDFAFQHLLAPFDPRHGSELDFPSFCQRSPSCASTQGGIS